MGYNPFELSTPAERAAAEGLEGEDKKETRVRVRVRVRVRDFERFGLWLGNSGPIGVRESGWVRTTATG